MAFWANWTSLSKRLDEWLIDQKISKKRVPTESDIDSWMQAAEARTGPVSREQAISYIKAKNSYRWWRLQHDYRWLQKQMKKMGLSPDDARELL